ncbi:F0F1 ATP synthase subunit A [[Phormidium ambiguum] IAM M-71]|uniref:ATP synthase subunit a n=1 Tax=[Phormidium ambiguum] IAM M-71 TaxID=454136 RepID=A0A1U7IRL9_9CYAN|nr:F0F1 ATP synthase subunit A [Phormidium ambiguum]OKH40046.1 F0F1 ATP synthase subunit A [Phormidium ambiguum IAM M-71]
MDITPDQIIIWRSSFITLNATILYTWLVMAFLICGSWWVTQRLSTTPQMSRWQNFLEALIVGIRDQIQEASGQNPEPYLPFVGTLFLFIATANLLIIIPGYHPPTGSISTTAALAICVFFAVPIYGIRQEGIFRYFQHYLQPSPFMLPFHIIGELSRTLALAIRLFGNVMSDGLIAAILLSIAPLFFPIIMQMLGLLTGLIQAYIFAILAIVYIASATQAHGN